MRREEKRRGKKRAQEKFSSKFNSDTAGGGGNMGFYHYIRTERTWGGDSKVAYPCRLI